MTDEGAKAIGKALEVKSTLTYLYLEVDDIGAEGAKAIGKALEMNSTWTDVNLCRNCIGDEGGQANAETFTNGARERLGSRMLDFVLFMHTDHGRVDDSKATMSDVRKLTEKKRTLGLNPCWNEIWEIGARAIGEAISNDDGLERCSMRGNQSTRHTRHCSHSKTDWSTCCPCSGLAGPVLLAALLL